MMRPTDLKMTLPHVRSNNSIRAGLLGSYAEWEVITTGTRRMQRKIGASQVEKNRKVWT
jgi:hypothetical protein